MDTGVRQSLALQKNAIEGVPVETRYMLVANERPGDSKIDGVTTAILFGLVGLFAVATIMRNTIFQPTGRLPKTPARSGGESRRVFGTGTFVLDQSGNRIRKRFISMPAVLARLEGGHLGLYANIDASS